MNRSAQSAAALQRVGTIATVCGCCGELFQARSVHAAWCSNACRRRAGYYRRSGRSIPSKNSRWTRPIRPQVVQPEILPATPAPFTFDGMQLRVTTDAQGVPWFVAADVCAALQIGNPSQALSRLDDDEKTLIANNSQGQQEAPTMNAVNEPGLYSLILGSRKPEAKRFKRWVTHEVLPAIRRTGSYGVPRREPELPQLPPSGPAILIRAQSDHEARMVWMDAVWQSLSADKRPRFQRVAS
jgi:prophage antirepressor-like protein